MAVELMARSGRFRLWILILGACAMMPAASRAQSFPENTHRVSAEDLRTAMGKEAAWEYNLMVTTTATRFATAVILDLVAQARSERPTGPPLLLHYDDWYESYRLTVGLDSSEVPDFIALQREYHQSRYIDYRHDGTRITVKKGPEPEQVIHVMSGWPPGDGVPERYTFVDSAASPTMRVTSKRWISYWLLQYSDMIVQDKVEGIGGRPLEGALGTVFKLLGDGRAVQARFAVSDDGLLVTYATAAKSIFKVHPTTVTSPDGVVQKDIPKDRDDLREIEKRLKQKLDVKYEQNGP